MSDFFNARYHGVCALPDCTRKREGEIEIGDVCTFVDGALVHLSCAGRVTRGEATLPERSFW